MTCIIGMIDKEEEIVMGGDAYGLCDDEICVLEEPKVWRNGELLVGACGLTTASNIVKNRMNWPEFGDDLQAWRIAAEDALMSALEGADLYKYCDKARTKRAPVQLIVGVRGRLLHFDESGASHLYSRRSVQIGQGCRVAYGAIYAASEYGASVEDQVRLGLAAASTNCTSVGPPFTILRSKDPDYVRTISASEALGPKGGKRSPTPAFMERLTH